MRTCYICGTTRNIETHHVFYGPFRAKSDKYGYVVDLCHACHNEPPNGVHFNKDLDRGFKKMFQKKAMKENGWSKEDFIREFGRSYL